MQKGERPPVAIRLQLNDVNESLVSPKAPLQNTAKPATPPDQDDRSTFEIVQSFQKPKSQKRNSANPSKQLKSEHQRVTNNTFIGAKRGQQSTTNKNTVSMVLQTPNQVSSATNKIKKTFNFEIDEQRQF